MNRCHALRSPAFSILFVSALVLISLAFSAGTAEVQRPNILFVFTDDHAYQAIGAYGSKVNRTPNIDRLATEGMLFRECYVTNSICGPSRATVQTGKYSHLNGFYRNGNRFNGGQQTFPKLLQKAGYQTAVFGKWHLETDPQGFDEWEILIGQGTYYNPTMIRNGQSIKHEGYTTEIITDLALNWLKNTRDQKKPFMLMYQHKAPHREWEPGLKYLHMYDDVTIPEPPTLFDDYSGRGTPARTQDMTIAKTMNDRDLKLTPPPDLSPQQRAVWDAAYNPKNEEFRRAELTGKDLVRWKYQRYMKDYLKCVAAVDDNLGRVLEYLDQTGLAKNTVVMYSSDQGFYLGEHGWFDKRWIYEESLRTALLVRWPGVVRPGSVNRDIVSNLDFAETFLDIAGVPVPSDMQGRSLVPLLQGSTPSNWRSSFYYHYYEFPGPHSVRKHFGVVTPDFKLIRFYEPDVNEWEMYGRKSDPQELKSVYGDPKYAAARKKLEQELQRLRKELKLPAEDPQESYPGGNPGRTTGTKKGD